MCIHHYAWGCGLAFWLGDSRSRWSQHSCAHSQSFTQHLLSVSPDLDQPGYARTWRSLVKITGPLLTAVNLDGSPMRMLCFSYTPCSSPSELMLYFAYHSLFLEPLQHSVPPASVYVTKETPIHLQLPKKCHWNEILPCYPCLSFILPSTARYLGTALL